MISIKGLRRVLDLHMLKQMQRSRLLLHAEDMVMFLMINVIIAASVITLIYDVLVFISIHNWLSTMLCLICSFSE